MRNVLYRQKTKTERKNRRLVEEEEEKKRKKKEKRREYTGHWTLEGGSFPAHRLSRCS